MNSWQSLPEAQTIAAREILARRAASEALQEFACFVKPGYTRSRHTEIICSTLERFVTGDIKRLMIFAPPQHSKSEHSSRMLPAYILGRKPSARILAVSYGISLATEFNRDVQHIMDSDGYKAVFPNSRLGGENVRTLSGRARRNADLFDVITAQGEPTGGMYQCAGKDGSITGKGFHYILIDDLIRTRAEADSPIERDNVYRAYEGTIRTRRIGAETGILILNTRWNEDDLSGRLLQKAQENPEADQWTVLSLPAIALDDDPFRAPGEALWPERFPLSDLLSTKASISSYEWASQYQQQPVAREGNVIKRDWFPIEYVIDPTQIEEKEIYWDLGASAEKTADQSVGTVVARMKDGKKYVLWQLAGRWNPGERNEQIKRFGLAWNRIFPQIQIDVEAGIGLGASGVEDLRNMLLDAGLTARIDRVTTSKYDRASNQKDSFFAAAESGRVVIYAGDYFKGFSDGSWIEPFFGEVTALQFKQTPRGIEFVGGHDDRLDSMVGAYNKVAKAESEFVMSFF